ncbi:MAG: hypothetical protein LQ352_005867 [Teloschistes flavicans]|nr:MAG: hypothetical protein LQ352_005867 [Teloschistes flavicans]
MSDIQEQYARPSTADHYYLLVQEELPEQMPVQSALMIDGTVDDEPQPIGTQLLKFKSVANMRAANHPDHQAAQQAAGQAAEQAARGAAISDKHQNSNLTPQWNKLSTGSIASGHTFALGDLREKSEDMVRVRGQANVVSAKVKLQSTKKMGRTRWDEGNLEWLDPHTNTWRPAVYHQEIRACLIHQSSHLGDYRYSMANRTKKDALDVTSFHPLFAENGSDRQNWPKILFQYQPTVADFEHSKASIWKYYDGRVILDLNDDAMYDYPEIPATLASNADSWLLVTLMRMNNHITLQDLRGRMPGELQQARADPMGRNRLSMNIGRFRKFSCCLTWNAIREQDFQRDYLEMKLPRRCHRLNSTESFRVLHAWEVAELDLKEAGKHLNRGRVKRKESSQAKKKRVYASKERKFTTHQKIFNQYHAKDYPNEYDTEDEEFRATIMNKTEAESVQPEAHHSSSQVVAPEDEINHVALAIKENSDGMGKIRNKRGTDADVKSEKDKKRRKVSFRDDYVLGGTLRYTILRFCPGEHGEYAGFLTMAPINQHDAQMLYTLLEPTRTHFAEITKLRPNDTLGNRCYKCQHGQIQEQINDWHNHDEEQKNYGLDAQDDDVEEPSEGPMLIGIQYAVGETLYWNHNWIEAWFGPRVYIETLEKQQTDGQDVWECVAEE